MNSRIFHGMTHKKMAFLAMFFLGIAILFGWLVTEYPPASGLFVSFVIFFSWGAGIHHAYAIPREKREF